MSVAAISHVALSEGAQRHTLKNHSGMPMMYFRFTVQRRTIFKGKSAKICRSAAPVLQKHESHTGDAGLHDNLAAP